MSAPRLSLTLALAFMASPVLADHAQPRDGGGNSSVGAQHHSGGGTAAPRTGSSSGSSGSSTSTPLTDAQRRHPQAATGSHYHSYYHPYYPYYYPYGGPYYWGYGYYPYYSGFYFGAGYYPFYGGAYYHGDDQGPYPGASGAVRLLVDPDKARVFVNGYYTGVVDDFDGLFQHLDLPAGVHQVKLQLEGYQTQRFKVYVAPDQTVKIRFEMVKGSGENTSELVVGDKVGAEAYMREAWRETRDRSEASRRPAPERGDRDLGAPSDVDRDRPPRAASASLHLTVEPADASVYVDGAFQGTARQSRSLDLPPGRHRIEIVRPGYRTLEREVEIEAGKPTNLDVTLEK
jgi:PEGA domain-containing protein